MTSHLYLRMAHFTTARMTAFKPGQSPPPVLMPILRISGMLVSREQDWDGIVQHRVSGWWLVASARKKSHYLNAMLAGFVPAEAEAAGVTSLPAVAVSRAKMEMPPLKFAVYTNFSLGSIFTAMGLGLAPEVLTA